MANVSIFGDKGFSLDFQAGKAPRGSWLDGKLRGRVGGSWSSASQRRFREYCVKHDCNALCWGVTLTVPGTSILDHQYFAYIFHKFSQKVNRLKIPMIWRIELQQRGMPHSHCVVYSNNTDDVLMFLDSWYSVLTVRQFQILPDNDYAWIPSAYLFGANYACVVERLVGNHRAFRYLVAHGSKSKKSQLGYVGRSWGVVNRALMRQVEGYDIPVEDEDYFRLLRWLRRLTRRKVRQGVSCWVSDPSTLRRMLIFLGYTV